MAWVKWKDGALVENTLHQRQGVGDDWREVIDEVVDTVDKIIVIIEEDGKLYRRTHHNLIQRIESIVCFKLKMTCHLLNEKYLEYYTKS